MESRKHIVHVLSDAGNGSMGPQVPLPFTIASLSGHNIFLIFYSLLNWLMS